MIVALGLDQAQTWSDLDPPTLFRLLPVESTAVRQGSVLGVGACSARVTQGFSPPCAVHPGNRGGLFFGAHSVFMPRFIAR